MDASGCITSERSSAFKRFDGVRKRRIQFPENVSIRAQIFHIAFNDEHAITRFDIRKTRSDPSHPCPLDCFGSKCVASIHFGTHTRRQTIRHRAKCCTHTRKIESHEQIKICRKQFHCINVFVALFGSRAICCRRSARSVCRR
jgi:hypothetical protein